MINLIQKDSISLPSGRLRPVCGTIVTQILIFPNGYYLRRPWVVTRTGTSRLILYPILKYSEDSITAEHRDPWILRVRKGEVVSGRQTINGIRIEMRWDTYQPRFEIEGLKGKNPKIVEPWILGPSTKLVKKLEPR
jgi:hypothetical protein